MPWVRVLQRLRLLRSAQSRGAADSGGRAAGHAGHADDRGAPRAADQPDVRRAPLGASHSITPAPRTTGIFIQSVIRLHGLLNLCASHKPHDRRCRSSRAARALPLSRIKEFCGRSAVVHLCAHACFGLQLHCWARTLPRPSYVCSEPAQSLWRLRERSELGFACSIVGPLALVILAPRHKDTHSDTLATLTAAYTSVDFCNTDRCNAPPGSPPPPPGVSPPTAGGLPNTPPPPPGIFPDAAAGLSSVLATAVAAASAAMLL